MRVNVAGQAMVERMTSVEIEDVLSSIRRLVTDDLRPKAVSTDSKLMLTPALRVVPDAAPTPDAASMPDQSQDTLEIDLDAELAAALADEQAHRNDAAHSGAAAMDGADSGSADVFPMFLHHDRRVDLAVETTSPEVADTVMAIGAGIPADGYEAELGDVMPVPDWPESSWVAPDAVDGVEEAELVVPSSDVAEAALADFAPQEPQASTDQPAAAELMLADLPDETADALAAAAAMDALAADDAAQQAAGLTELDEDMLREIVRDIIREELHGTLGEKITRNVRKLVRAEINRALMTQDLE